MNELAHRQQQMPTADVVEDLIARGDLSKLSPAQRVVHYHNRCRAAGLDPQSQPFQYVYLQGKLVLYMTKAGTEQLRAINKLSLAIVNRTIVDGILTVHAKAMDKDGRSDEDFGVVSVAGLKGEALSNAHMKAVTKAKRRVTLSMASIGLPDESELDGVPRADFANVDINTGQITTDVHPSMTQDERTQRIEDQELRREQQKEDSGVAHPPQPQSDPLKKLDEIARLQAERAATAPFEIARTDNDVPAWTTWGTQLLAYVKAAPSTDVINEWTNLNAGHLAALRTFDAERHQRLVDRITHEISIRQEQGS